MDFRSFIIRWNNNHPLDKKFREKYNIAFNSEEHRKINQIDILLEYIEDQLYDDSRKEIEIQLKEEDEYKKGNWIKNNLDKQDEIDLFDRIDIKKFNNDSDQIKIE